MSTTAINRTWIELVQGVPLHEGTTIIRMAALASGPKRFRGKGVRANWEDDFDGLKVRGQEKSC